MLSNARCRAEGRSRRRTRSNPPSPRASARGIQRGQWSASMVAMELSLDAGARTRKTPRMAARTIPGLVRVRVSDIRPSPENESLYRPVLATDPAIRALAASIAEHGLLQPLTISMDRYLISGHRRLMASRLAGLEKVPCD